MKLKSFSQYLTEKAHDPNYGLGNDSKGKIHEALVGHFLMHPKSAGPHKPETHEPNMPVFATRPKPLPGEKETKEKKTDTVDAVHDSIKKTISSTNYEHHIRMAKFAADHIRKGLEENGHISKNGNSRITNVYWTSRPSDIQRLSGHHDSANVSDIALHVKRKGGRIKLPKPAARTVVETNGGPGEGGEHIGISLKTHNSPKVLSLSNPGRGTVDKLLGVNTDHIENNLMKKTHAIAAQVAGINTSKMPKREAHNLLKNNAAFTEHMKDHKTEALSKLTSTYADKLKSLTPSELGDKLKDLANIKPTKMKFYKSATFGSDKLTHHFGNPAVEMDSILAAHHGHIKVSGVTNSNISFSGKKGAALGGLNIKHQGGTAYTSLQAIMKGWNKEAAKDVKDIHKKSAEKKHGYGEW